MLSYIVRRIGSMIPSLLLASIIVFSFIHLIPGDPAQIMLGDQATPEQVQGLREASHMTWRAIVPDLSGPVSKLLRDKRVSCA